MKHYLRILPLVLLLFGSMLGTRAATPTSPSKDIRWYTPEGNYLGCYWTNGDGAKRIVIARAGSPVSAKPVNGRSYRASDNFGEGEAIAPGEFVVGYGGANSIQMYKLTPGVTYHIAVFEFNGADATAEYLTTAWLNSENATVGQPSPPTAISFSNITTNSVKTDVAPGTGTGGRLIVMREDGTTQAEPANFTRYNGNPTFGVGTMIGDRNYVVLSHSGSNSTTTVKLKNNTRYHVAAYDYNGSDRPVYSTPAKTGTFITLSEPTEPPKPIRTDSRDTRQFRILFEQGNGSKRIVIGRKGAPVTSVPQDGQIYTAKQEFGTGTEVVNDEFVVYAGDGWFTTITGLDPTSTYHFRAFEYEDGSATDYLTSAFSEGTGTTLSLPTTGPSNFTATDIRADRVTLRWTGGDGNNRLLIGRAGSAVDATPVDFTKYNGNATFGSGDQIGNGNFVLADYTYVERTIYGLTPGVTYHFALYEANGTVNPLYLRPPVTVSATTVVHPTTHPTNLKTDQIGINTMRVYYDAGNGQKMLVIAKKGSPVTATPADKVIYKANAAFGDPSTAIAQDEFVVYNATWQPTYLSNLDPNSTYHFKVINYNELNGEPYYYVGDPVPTVSGTTLDYARPQASNLTFPEIAHTSIKLKFTAGGGARRLITYKAGSAVDAHPSDGSGYGVGGHLGNNVYVGGYTDTDEITVNNLTPGTTYHFAVYEMLPNLYYYSTPPLTGQSATSGQSQTIDFAAIPTKTYGDADFDLGATATSGLQVAYESSNPQIAEITNGKLHIKRSGSAVITATQNGDGTYAAAPPVQRTLQIAKAKLDIRADNFTIAYNDDLPTLTATYEHFVLGETEAVLTAPPMLQTNAVAGSPGDYVINISGATALNYDITHIPGMLTITPKPRQVQTIDFTAIPPVTYGAANIVPQAQSTSGLDVFFTSETPEVAQIVNGEIRIVGAGTATITANCPGDGTWEPAPPVSIQLVVNKAELRIIADNKEMTEGDIVPDLTATYQGFVYNEQPAALTTLPTLSTNASQSSTPGDYPIEISGATSPNYDIQMETGVLTVKMRAKRQQTINFPAIANKTYGNAEFAPGANASSNLTVTYTTTTPTVVTIVNGQVKIVGTGTASVKASQAGDAQYEAAPDVTRTFAVQKATLHVKANDAQKEEGAANPFFTVTYTGFVYGENESVLTQRATPTTNANNSTPPGIYDIFPGSAVAANYTMTYENGKLTVTARPRQAQTITFPQIAAKKYGDADFAAGATTTSPLPVRLTSLTPAVATIVNGRIHIVKAGTATIRAEQDGDGDYLPATPVDRVVTIGKAILTATPQNASKVYLEPNPDIDIRYAGFVNGEDESVVLTPPVVNTQATQQSPVGEYEIWLTGGTAENYQFSFTEAKLTITPKAQTIQFTQPANKTYGDADFVLAANASSNLAVRFVSETPDLIAITGTQVRILKAGTARIRAEQDGNANWQAAPNVTQTFTIDKALLTVTAENKSRAQGTDNPDLTVAYTGFRNGDDATDIQTPPVVSTTADRTSPPGTYEIVASGAAADNYRFTYVPGTLTVTARSQAQTITFGNLAARTYGDADFAPGARASSNLTVTYASSNPRVATVVNGQLHIVGAGTSVITARQAGNDEWQAATPVSKTLTVQKARLTITAANKSKEVGEPTPALTATYSGFVLGEGPAVLGTVTLRTPVTEYSRAGRYPITIHVGNVANYNVATVNGVLTVTDKPKDVLKAWASSRSTIQVSVFVLSAQSANVLLYSTSGQRVVQLVKRLDAGKNTFQLDVSHVPTGMYILQIGGDKVNLTQNVAIN